MPSDGGVKSEPQMDYNANVNKSKYISAISLDGNSYNSIALLLLLDGMLVHRGFGLPP